MGQTASSLSTKDALFELSMSICGGAMEYFMLDDLPAEDVVDYICLMTAKGKRIEDPEPKKEVKKRVYADQANWY